RSSITVNMPAVSQMRLMTFKEHRDGGIRGSVTIELPSGMILGNVLIVHRNGLFVAELQSATIGFVTAGVRTKFSEQVIGSLARSRPDALTGTDFFFEQKEDAA